MNPTSISRDRAALYPVADSVPWDERKRLGLGKGEGYPLLSMGQPARGVHARRTGEFRPPKAGEWYLSGAIVEAWRAPNDLTQSFHIAILVRTKTETRTITRELDPIAP